ncbi:nucleolar and coiled-body phosphoprotein 1 [Peltigera leucophlebia]|nr:nucleolar and coiled-body phosphoprotein 1 [Peltigera leucophlebia]
MLGKLQICQQVPQRDGLFMQGRDLSESLHHALSKCSSLEKGISDISPPLLREQGLRKRNKRTVEDTSDPGSAPAIGSVARQSASASATSKRPTRSVASADLKKRVAQPTRSVATLDMEKRDSLPTRSLATLALENRHLDPARSVATLALERRNATPADATPTGATPAKATPAKATPAEATPTEATPAGATPLEATLTSASSLTSSATSPPKPTRSALQRRNHAHLPRAAKSQAARR